MSLLGRSATRPRRSGLATAVAILCLALPSAVIACLLLGTGLAVSAPAAWAFAAALAITLLPVLGIGAVLARFGVTGIGARLAATWIWTLAVLIAFPAFAPGMRGELARRGAEALLGPLPALLGGPLVSAVGTLASLPGSEGTSPDEPADATGSGPGAADDSGTGALSVPVPDDRPATTRREDRSPIASVAPGGTGPVELPYRGDGRELDVEVGLDGPRFGEHVRMIFDTGASFTTVTPDTLDRIDVAIPGDAPRVRLNTAGGEIEAPLVLLDAVWMGDRPIEWVTVAACPSCTAPGRSGLIGLNVSSQFRVQIDASRKRIHLDPTPGDRVRDVRPWVRLRARGTQHGDERIDFEVTLENRAPRAIASATVEIDCGASGFAVELADVPARGEVSSALSVPATDGCEGFGLDLLSARWVLDRF